MEMPSPSKWGDTDPNMSDAALLVSVEDLINMAMGPDEQNTVNYKLVQMILHILARQMRMLETRVEVKIATKSVVEEMTDTKKKMKRRTNSPSSSSLKERGRTKSQIDDPKIRGKDKERDEGFTSRVEEENKERLKGVKAQTKGQGKSERREMGEVDEVKTNKAKQKDGIEIKERRGTGIPAQIVSETTGADDQEEYDDREYKRPKKPVSRDKSKTGSNTRSSTDKGDESEDGDKKHVYDDEGDEFSESKKDSKGIDFKKHRSDISAFSKSKKYKSETSTTEPKTLKSDISALSALSDPSKHSSDSSALSPTSGKRLSPRSGKEDKEKKQREDDREKKYKEDDIDKIYGDREKNRKEEDGREKRHGKEMYKTDMKDRGTEERGRTPSRTGISVKGNRSDASNLPGRTRDQDRTRVRPEEGRGPKGDKVLVVEKNSTTRTDSRTKLGSIDVVTRVQFEELQSEVRDMKKKAGPLPMPAMPDNQKLRKELARGSATLGDTMQAMQVAARVEAAEKAIGRMAGLLTQLAAAGALPDDVANQVENVTAEMEAAAAEIQAVKQQIGGHDGAGTGPGVKLGAGLSTGTDAGAVVGVGPKLGGWPLPLAGVGGPKSVAIDPATRDTRAAGPHPSVTSRISAASGMSPKGTCVTQNDLDEALAALKDQLAKNLTNMTSRATTAAETASAIAKAVAEKLDIALKLNLRISTLHSMVEDYSEQLSGFDVGFTTQMQSFQEQMSMIRTDLQQGLEQLATANNNAETAALMELSERYDDLVSELDNTVRAHTTLTAFQNQLREELKSLAESVETLREQKADCDEVQDGLRDKADNSRLAGLLTEYEFTSSRNELERRLDCCYDKFRKQESVWMGALKDLTGLAEQKAEMMQLMAARDDAQQQLREIKENLATLAILLGEPKAALLTRQMSRGGACGACLLPALQDPVEPSVGQPHALPAARPAPLGEEDPCAPPFTSQPHDQREHTCLRWVGGSHTLVTDAVRRVQAEPLDHGVPTNRYAGYGTDGRLYLMEDELAPCVPCFDCNPKSGDIIAEKMPEKYNRRFDNLPGEEQALKVEDGAGDTGGGRK